LAASLPSLQNVHLITNAIRVPDVVRSVEGIVDALSGTAAKLHVMVSLDGLGEVHDRVRGRLHLFARDALGGRALGAQCAAESPATGASNTGSRSAG
jgi:hypothetical protein